MTGLEALGAEYHLDRQLQLVREHWTSVRRLWLGDSECRDVATFRSDLPDDFVLGCGMPGIARVKPINDGQFEFDEDGLTAIIVPAYDGLPGLLDANPERHVEHLRDLVAVDREHPDRFWRRRGEAVVLGNAFLEIAGETCAAIPVFKNPLSWLRSAGAGVVVLDWDTTHALLLDRELIAEDLELGAALEDALKPEIWIMEAAA